MNPYWALCLSILLAIAGQLLLKTGTTLGVSEETVLPHPAILAGLACYGVGALVYLQAIRTIPLSVAYPSLSISYVLVAVLAHFIWREPLSWQHLAALVLIVSGIYLLFRA